METVITMEQIIEVAEKRGWRVSNLSHVAGVQQFSCILERKRTGDDGFPVFALGRLSPTPKEALQSAWEQAQQPIGNPRVASRRAHVASAVPRTSTLAQWLQDNMGCRVSLEDALSALQNAHSGEDDGEDSL